MHNWLRGMDASVLSVLRQPKSGASVCIKSRRRVCFALDQNWDPCDLFITSYSTGTNARNVAPCLLHYAAGHDNYVVWALVFFGSREAFDGVDHWVVTTAFRLWLNCGVIWLPWRSSSAGCHVLCFWEGGAIWRTNVWRMSFCNIKTTNDWKIISLITYN